MRLTASDCLIHRHEQINMLMSCSDSLGLSEQKKKNTKLPLPYNCTQPFVIAKRQKTTRDDAEFPEPKRGASFSCWSAARRKIYSANMTSWWRDAMRHVWLEACLGLRWSGREEKGFKSERERIYAMHRGKLLQVFEVLFGWKGANTNFSVLFPPKAAKHRQEK